jgi:hypothetical protein
MSGVDIRILIKALHGKYVCVATGVTTEDVVRHVGLRTDRFGESYLENFGNLNTRLRNVP